MYPAGTTVRTNERETGIVLYQNKDFPDRPVLRIIKDKDGRNVDLLKDLGEIDNVYIEDVID